MKIWYTILIAIVTLYIGYYWGNFEAYAQIETFANECQKINGKVVLGDKSCYCIINDTMI